MMGLNLFPPGTAPDLGRLERALSEEVSILQANIEVAREKISRARTCLEAVRVLRTYIGDVESGEITPAKPSETIFGDWKVDVHTIRQDQVETGIGLLSQMDAQRARRMAEWSQVSEPVSLQMAIDPALPLPPENAPEPGFECETCSDTGMVDDSAGGVGPAASMKSPCPDCRDPVPEPEPKDGLEQLPKRGPWNDTFLAACRAEQLAGATLKELADKYEVAYPEFTAALKKYRLANPEPKPRPSLPPTPRPSADPDPDRESSGWTVVDDIRMLEELGMGTPARDVARLMQRPLDDLKVRYDLLVPDKDAARQGMVLTKLRQLRDQGDPR